ncbi:hypothetical protein N9051_01650 [Akkermansiaceae bacterium]|nr:hypothetical protein [Akkermansiaceae bacterium]
MKTLLTLLLLVPFSLLKAREWRLTNGKKPFEASLVSLDDKQVTLRRGDKTLTFDIEELHADDQAWLKEKDAEHNGVKKDFSPPPEGSAFGHLQFGDSKATVIKKLKSSPLVEGGAADVMVARIGLNGTYRTKNKLGGLPSDLFFDWTKTGRLREITFRSKPLEIGSYDKSIKACWSETQELINQLHGRPIQNSPYPSSDELKDGLILCSHLWRSSEGHSILLGTGQERKNYSVILRITSQKFQPALAR